MQLTEEERVALDRWHRNQYIIEAEDIREGLRVQFSDACILADAMNRLVPVRTYGNLVIRWDDEITPERLVACGGEMASLTDPLATTCVVDMGNKLWAWFRGWQPIIWLRQGVGIHELALPRNMLEVWHLMERCGIEDNTNQRSQS